MNDSKQLSAAEREALWAEFEALAAQGQIHANFGSASVEEIELHNILGATKLAMRRALEGIYPAAAFRRSEEPDLFSSLEERESFVPTVSCRVLVDGLPLKGFPYPHTAVVSGDAKSLCIAMGSIIAKVARDRMMAELDAGVPGLRVSRSTRATGPTTTGRPSSGSGAAPSTGRCSCASCSRSGRTRTRWIFFPAVDPWARRGHKGRRCQARNTARSNG